MRRHPRRVSLLVAAATFAATWAMALPAHSAEVSWTIAPAPAAVGIPESLLRSVSCVSAQACMAVGNERRRAASEKARGAERRLAPPRAGTAPRGPWFPTPASAGGEPGAELRLVRDGGVLRGGRVRHSVNGTARPLRGNLLERALLETWNGTSWARSRIQQPRSRGSALSGVTCRRAHPASPWGQNGYLRKVCAVGDVERDELEAFQSPPRPRKTWRVPGRVVSCICEFMMAVGAYNANPRSRDRRG